MRNTVFPKLPLLAAFADKLKTVGLDFNSTVVVCVQHVLTETGALLEAAIRTGTKPEHIYLLGKPYSTNYDTFTKIKELGVNGFHTEFPRSEGRYSEVFSKAIDRLWDTVVCRLEQSQHSGPILVLDDGGYCLSRIPRSVRQRSLIVGIEQTSSGIQKKYCFSDIPVIAVASSAAKRIIEPAIVSRAVADKLSKRVSLQPIPVCGVIGLGNIGETIAAQNIQAGRKTYVYDSDNHVLKKFVKNYPSAVAMENVISLIHKAHLIFGCAGNDVIRDITDWRKLGAGHKILASCSSGDVEFKTLLRSECGKPEDAHNPFSIIRYNFGSLTIDLLEGGFPITFDREPISAPLEDIQFTRTLLFAALAQGFFSCQSKQTKAGLLALSPALQKWIVQEWFRLRPIRRQDYVEEDLNGFQNVKWIEQYSEGRMPPLSVESSFLD